MNVEAATIESRQEQLPLAATDLIEAVGEEGGFDIPIEIIAQTSAGALRNAA